MDALRAIWDSSTLKDLFLDVLIFILSVSSIAIFLIIYFGIRLLLRLVALWRKE